MTEATYDNVGSNPKVNVHVHINDESVTAKDKLKIE